MVNLLKFHLCYQSSNGGIRSDSTDSQHHLYGLHSHGLPGGSRFGGFHGFEGFLEVRNEQFVADGM